MIPCPGQVRFHTGMICLGCSELRFGFPGRLCPVCAGPLVPETAANRAALFSDRFEKDTARWLEQGSINSETAAAVRLAIAADREAANAGRGASTAAATDEDSFLPALFQPLADHAAGLVRQWRALLVAPPKAGSFRGKLPDSERPRTRTRGSLKEAARAAHGMTGGGGHWGSLDEVSRLDAIGGSAGASGSQDERALTFWSALQPLFNTYVWWFIGTLLVLAGSILGIREAWLVLSGVSRQLTVLGALFAYHALFAALGLALTRRSRLTGVLLSTIGLLLLAVPYSVAADVYALDPSLGVASLAGLLLLSVASVALAARPFRAQASTLVFALLPAYFIQSLLPLRDMATVAHVLVLAALLPFVRTAVVFARRSEDQTPGALLFSLYASLGALAVYLLRFTSVPGALRPGTIEFGVVLLWFLVCTAALAGASGAFQSAARSFTRLIAGVSFLASSLVAALLGAAGLLAAPPGLLSVLEVGPALELLVPLLAVFVLLGASRAHPPAAMAALALAAVTGGLFARECTGQEGWWAVGAAVVPLGLLSFRRALPDRFARLITISGAGAGLSLCMFLIYWLGPAPIPGARGPLWIGGALLALAAHPGAGRRYPWLHFVGAFGLFTLTLGLVSFLENVAWLWPDRLAAVCGLAALSYAAVALVLESERTENEQAFRLRPFDDISLAFAMAGGMLVVGPPFAPPASLLVASVAWARVDLLAPVALGLILLGRAVRDRSVLVSFAGIALLGTAVFRLLGGPAVSSAAFGAAAAAVAAAFLASLFPKLKAGAPEARQVFFVLRLPFPSSGPALVRDGLAATATTFAGLAAFKLALWLGGINEPERSQAIAAGILLSSVPLFALLAGGFRAFRLRGELYTLVAFAVCATLTAVVNRMGRPLPPGVVGLNLSLGVIGLFVVSQVLKRWGPPLSLRLEAPAAGRHYETVTLAGMLALGGVLLLDVFLLGPGDLDRALSVVPPTFFVGAGLSAILFGRALGLYPFFHVGFGLFLCAAGLGFAQGSFFGANLVQLNPPTGTWTPLLVPESVADVANVGWPDQIIFLPQQLLGAAPVRRLGFGLALAGTLFALCSALLGAGRFGAGLRRICFGPLESRAWSGVLALWSLVPTALLGVIGFQTAFVGPAVIALAGGAVLLFAGQLRVAAVAVAFQGLLLVHGLAHTAPLLAAWAGPVLALLGLVLTLLPRLIARRAQLPYGRALEGAHSGALSYGLAAIVYAIAATGPLHAGNAVPTLLDSAALGLSLNAWLSSPAFGLTLALLAMGLLVASRQWTQVLSTALATGSTITFGLSAATLFPLAWSLWIGAAPGISLWPWLPFFTACLVAVAVLSQVFNDLGRARTDWAYGIGHGRDSLIALAALCFALDQRFGAGAVVLFSRAASIVAILLVIVVSLWAALRNLQARHIYFVQTAIACLYAVLKPLFGSALPAEFDAFAALLFGFALVGVTVWAHRAGVPPLAESTRRFAAVMPLAAFLILPRAPTIENAGMAALAGVLYSALAAASGSRLLAILAALAANVALLTAALASQVQGIEVFLAPLGLMTLLLGHIFRQGLPQRAREGVRLVGGLLLYVPAAVKITLEIGRGVDLLYTMVFGAVCLVAVAAGMLLRIRSYLFMGTLFLTLDVLANLVQTGLRDRRTAFVLLSATGLLIIGGLVVATLRREQLSGTIRRLSHTLRRWD